MRAIFCVSLLFHPQMSMENRTKCPGKHKDQIKTSIKQSLEIVIIWDLTKNYFQNIFLHNFLLHIIEELMNSQNGPQIQAIHVQNTSQNQLLIFFSFSMIWNYWPSFTYIFLWALFHCFYSLYPGLIIKLSYFAGGNQFIK